MAPPISEAPSNGGREGDRPASPPSPGGSTSGGHPRLAARGFTRPILCAVLDVAGLGGDPKSTALAYFEAGVDWIQLRDRDVSDLECLVCARALTQARDAHREAHPSDGRRAVLVNKRVDLAGVAGADGAHLGFDSLPEAEVFRAATALWAKHAETPPASKLVFGRARHSVAEVRAAAVAVEHGTGNGNGNGAESAPAEAPSKEGLHYVHLAPIWNPKSKPASRPPLGEDLLRDAVAAAGASLAVIAQGGLDADRARRAIQAGAAGIAVTGTLTRGEDSIQTLRGLRTALDACTGVAP